MKHAILLVATLQAACIVKSGGPATTYGASSNGAASSSGSPSSSSAANGNATVPSMFRMTESQAREALANAGFAAALRISTIPCDSTYEGVIIEIGEVCQQQPAAGKVQSARLGASVQIQREDPRKGKVGTPDEWRLLPDLTGKRADDVDAEMKRHGFKGGDGISVREVDESGCSSGVVCRTLPSGLQRARIDSGITIYVGRKPTAPAAP